MNDKGLCLTCAYDKRCLFPRKYPIFECDEFSTVKVKPIALKRKKIRRKHPSR